LRSERRGDARGRRERSKGQRARVRRSTQHDAMPNSSQHGAHIMPEENSAAHAQRRAGHARERCEPQLLTSSRCARPGRRLRHEIRGALRGAREGINPAPVLRGSNDAASVSRAAASIPEQAAHAAVRRPRSERVSACAPCSAPRRAHVHPPHHPRPAFAARKLAVGLAASPSRSSFCPAFGTPRRDGLRHEPPVSCGSGRPGPTWCRRAGRARVPLRRRAVERLQSRHATSPQPAAAPSAHWSASAAQRPTRTTSAVCVDGGGLHCCSGGPPAGTVRVTDTAEDAAAATLTPHDDAGLVRVGADRRAALAEAPASSVERAGPASPVDRAAAPAARARRVVI